MRFTSLIVELIRARPRLVIWVVLLVQATIWLVLPLLIYGSPPADVATALAIGREYRLGTPDGPPLAFWLADIAFRAAGNHIAGVYLLAQICFLLTFWWLYQLGRAIVGGPHAVLAVLLTVTVTTFSSPGVAFGPDSLARPLWALLLLQTWRLIGHGRRQAWVMLAVAAGLLVLTTSAAPALLAFVAAVILAMPGGRRRLASVDLLYALLIVAVIVLPYGLWLLRNGAPALALPALNRFDAKGLLALWLLGGLLFSMTGVIVLTMMTSRRLNRFGEKPPVIARAGVDPVGRRFVMIFALVPALIGCVVAGLYGWDNVVGGAGIALLPAGLAVIVLSGDLIALRQYRLLRKVWALAVIAPAVLAAAIVFVQPWIRDEASATTLPATAIARFFGENYERRTGKPLQAVAGDPQLAALVAMGRSRPHLLLDDEPARTPWLTPSDLIERGGVVLWRATDALGTPPAAIARRFPGLVAEVPRGFDRLVNGRQPPLRIGWAIIRPKASQ
ncbi:MAG: hypothetical protein JWQ51_2669 [Tardiphaga sp.]|nr:hypothetical protein [Tardiphaga sp.]